MRASWYQARVERASDVSWGPVVVCPIVHHARSHGLSHALFSQLTTLLSHAKHHCHHAFCHSCTFAPSTLVTLQSVTLYFHLLSPQYSNSCSQSHPLSCSYALSGTLDPYVVSCGANPCVFGMLALMSVELMQSWKVSRARSDHIAHRLYLCSWPLLDNVDCASHIVLNKWLDFLSLFTVFLLFLTTYY